MLRALLHRRAATACLALSLTMYACPEELGDVDSPSAPVQNDAPPAEPAPDDDEPDLDDAEAEPEAEPEALQLDAKVSNDHPDGEDVGMAVAAFCDGLSAAVVSGTLGVAAAGSILGLQIYFDANGNGSQDDDEAPNPGTTTTVAADGSFLLGAPLFQYGSHGVSALAIDGMFAPADVIADLTFEVDAAEGEAARWSAPIFLDGFESGDTSAWSTCP